MHNVKPQIIILNVVEMKIVPVFILRRSIEGYHVFCRVKLVPDAQFVVVFAFLSSFQFILLLLFNLMRFEYLV